MNVDITFDKNILYNDGKAISLPSVIKKTEIIEDKIIVLLESSLDSKANNENILGFDFDLNLIWGIAPRTYHIAACPYMNIWKVEDELHAYAWCGVEVIIDVCNGKIISSEFTK